MSNDVRQLLHLEHIVSAIAVNLIRLDNWWNGHPLERKRTSHLADSNQP
ncbi:MULTISPECIES: hypothetical protein [unclassified Nonomuraea]